MIGKVSDSKSKLRKSNNSILLPNALDLAMSISLKEKHYGLINEFLDKLKEGSKNSFKEIIYYLYQILLN